MYLLSSDKLDLLDDDSDDDGSDSGSSGTYSFCAFPCVLTILLVVLVLWGMECLYQQELIPNVICLSLSCLYQ